MSRLSLLKPLTLAILLFATSCGSEPSVPHIVGTLEWDRVELIAEASEPILELLVIEGERVEPGRALVQFDPQRRLAQLNEARATREQAAARLLELERGPRMEDIQ